ncbi:2-oxoadipate dioxygenase/decarboxylase HglS [Hyphomonas sp. NPDC076900]|uniref:2-oxoadipate dioxygenase/decarboxylase HglS n=1 Tax=unclassified Hyphomonas TaxID=2630699 RepID=UPI003D03B1B9
MTKFLSSNAVRSAFSSAMAQMYRKEVPAYGELQRLVADINSDALATLPGAATLVGASGGIERLSAERHGAIRVGTAEELRWIRRAFAIMGMHPVGYYDLAGAGLPVHATAFRPTDPTALAVNPFRIFCSLLRLDRIADTALRNQAKHILSRRQIFSAQAMKLIESIEQEGGVREGDLDHFLNAVLATFGWHGRAQVSYATYQAFMTAHRLVADIVCFPGPHINHLTPRTLDIDAVQAVMPARNMPAKAIIEGPPKRACPILLRQTSFKALSESVLFPEADGRLHSGTHTARFGEVEQRGVALTPKGRALYDRLLSDVFEAVTPAPDGSNAEEYGHVLNQIFNQFPDDWSSLRRGGLAYFDYGPQPHTEVGDSAGAGLEDLIRAGRIVARPILYEDFLPVSAAGIFRSNLGDASHSRLVAEEMQAEFEDALGVPVADPFGLYEMRQAESLRLCRSTCPELRG